MRRIRRNKAVNLKCECCFQYKDRSAVTLPWNKNTHWMYHPDLKRVALYLLWVGKHPDNLFRLLTKDIWLIIMRHALMPNYKSPSTKKDLAPYCDDCMKKLYLLPPCIHCHDESKVAANIIPDFYIDVHHNKDWVKVPVLCEKCNMQIYTCELHKSKAPRYRCHKCKPDRNSFDQAFRSPYWRRLAMLPAK